jgi:hypothetical protein
MCSPTSDDRPYSLTNSNSTLAAAVNVTAARPAIAPQAAVCDSLCEEDSVSGW